MERHDTLDSNIESQPPRPSSPLLGDDQARRRNSDETSIVASPTGSHSTSPIRQNTQRSTQSVSSPQHTSTIDSHTLQSQQQAQASNQRPEEKHRTLSEQHYLQRLRNAFEPAIHDLKEHSILPPEKTVRPYYHRQQKWRLWRKTIGEFIITLILCTVYFVVLYVFHLSNALEKSQREWFNALVTGIALCLGVNLSASLRSYAKMLRWRMLARRFRSLRNFDLILGCDSTWNVIKLIQSGRSKHNRFPLNSLVQIYAIAWLAVQIGIAISVGIIGLTYNLNVSPTELNIQIGNTSVLDLSSISSGSTLQDLSRINIWAVKSDAFEIIDSPDLSYDDQIGPVILSDGNGNSRYWFIDAAANDNQNQAVSFRSIDAMTTCRSYNVTSGIYGNSTTITYINDGHEVKKEIFARPGIAGLYVQGDINPSCGSRCTSMIAFLSAVPPEDAQSYLTMYGTDIPTAMFYQCNTTVTNVNFTYPDGSSSAAMPEYEIKPLISRMLAGAWAWSDNPLQANQYLYEVYSDTSELGRNTVQSDLDMANEASALVAGAIQAMDRSTLDNPYTTYVQRQYITDGREPIQAQVLDVKWWAAGTLLGVIPFVQFWLTVIVIAIANKTVIKDDAHIAIAKVYHTLLQKLGPHGCILDGDQLIDALGNPRVAYAYSEVSTSLRHVDVYEQDSGLKIDRRFPEGDYDGDGEEFEAWSYRSKGPTFDAYQYF